MRGTVLSVNGKLIVYDNNTGGRFEIDEINTLVRFNIGDTVEYMKNGESGKAIIYYIVRSGSAYRTYMMENAHQSTFPSSRQAYLPPTPQHPISRQKKSIGMNLIKAAIFAILLAVFITTAIITNVLRPEHVQPDVIAFALYTLALIVSCILSIVCVSLVIYFINKSAE